MPSVPVRFNEETDEIIVGTIPGRDGSGYSPSLPSPSFYDLLGALEKYYVKSMVLIAVGKLYKTRTAIGGVSIDTRFHDVYNADHDNPYATTEEKVEELFELVDGTPQHVTGFVIRPM